MQNSSQSRRVRFDLNAAMAYEEPHTPPGSRGLRAKAGVFDEAASSEMKGFMKKYIALKN